MKVRGDLSECGSVQLMYAGTIKFDTTGASTGVELCKLPANVAIVKATAVVKTAFNAGTTNVLTVGANSDIDDILGESDVTEGTAGVYAVNKFVEYTTAKTIKAKFTETGTAATTGEADIYIEVSSIPE